MDYILKRKIYNKGVIGELYRDFSFVCNTLENRDKIIPIGKYPISITYSPKFKKDLPQIYVPNRYGIRIHSGNKPEDSIGCVLVGIYSNDKPDWISNSIITLNNLFSLFTKDKNNYIIII